jgi:hypothetical protein
MIHTESTRALEIEVGLRTDLNAETVKLLIVKVLIQVSQKVDRMQILHLVRELT